jgi:hypothetical protein
MNLPAPVGTNEQTEESNLYSKSPDLCFLSIFYTKDISFVEDIGVPLFDSKKRDDLLLSSSFFCGGYRSRTDDLLRARQAL